MTKTIGCVCWISFCIAVTAAAGDHSKSGSVAEESIHGLAEKVRRSVVEILGTVQATGDTSYGTGFVLLQRNLVVTNAHVVRGVKDLIVRTNEGAAFASVEVLHVNEGVDLAVLRVIGLDVDPLSLSDRGIPSVGTAVVAVGHPRGYEYTVSNGIVSALRSLDPESPLLIQTTAPISPGSSGGPLLDMEGRIVGVCSLTLTEGQNINFAVPAREVGPVLERALRIEKNLADGRHDDLSPEDLARIVRGHRKQGDLVRAGTLVRKALGVHQGSLPLLLEAAEVAWSRGSYREVEAIVERMRSIDPTFAGGRQIHAAYLAQAGDCEGAIREGRKSLEGLLDKEQEAEAHAVLAECLGRVGQNEAALEHVDRALESPEIAGLPDYHALRAFLLQAAGRAEEADREAVVALELAGWDPMVVSALRERGLPRLVDVVSYKFEKDGRRFIVRGIVRNVGPVPLEEILVTAEGRDDTTTVVATGTARVQPERLVPGQSGAFEVLLAGAPEEVATYDVRVLDYRE